MPTPAKAAQANAASAATTAARPGPEPFPATLAASLALLQTRLPVVGKDKTAKVTSEKGNYTYRYADLADISKAAMPLLGAVGLSFSAKPTLTDNGQRFVLAYTLRHVSGETDSGEYPLSDPARTKPQAMGSEITYARRYSFCSVIGLAPDADDDDAAAAQAGRSAGPYQAEGPPPEPEHVPSGRDWVTEAKALTTEQAVIDLGRAAHEAGEFTGAVKAFLVSRRQEVAAAARTPNGSG